jgi:hypothetical protein
MKTTIICGPAAKYTLVHQVLFQFGVYQKDYPNGAVRWVIARQDYADLPGSVCTEYLTKDEAVNSLNRWASAPVPPDPIRKREEPGVPKSHSGIRRKWRIGAAQQAFNFL